MAGGPRDAFSVADREQNRESAKRQKKRGISRLLRGFAEGRSESSVFRDSDRLDVQATTPAFFSASVVDLASDFFDVLDTPHIQLGMGTIR